LPGKYYSALKFLRFIPAVAWFFISLYLLCLPGSKIPKYPFLALIHADKWVHIGMFGILCFLFNRAFNKIILTRSTLKKYLLAVTLAGIAYGTIMEFVQKYWIPDRSFELLDILADSIGCLLALLYCRRKF